jgi:tRNA pseudouridine55 synthase
MLGVINLDKPVGPTSHDMVGLMRRLTGTRRIGHAGTLDPLASGVLPILVDAATRFSADLTGGPKRYDAVIRLGWRSATDDGQGPIVRGGQVPSVAEAVAALPSLVGTFDQRPPAFSARKMGGQTGHRTARAGKPLDLPARRVTVERIDVLETDAAEDHLDLRIDLRCGPGTYVRSIARDLGERLGCGGHLAALRRTEAAGLMVADAHSPEELEALAATGRLNEAMVPVTDLLPLPRIQLTPLQAERFAHGSPVAVDPGSCDGRSAVLSDGRLIGTGRIAAGILQPEKVIAAGAGE